MKNQKSRAFFFLSFIVVIALSGCASEADKETVQAVSRQISEIGEVTLEKADMINEIQKAYESLNEKQKKLLDNYETLESASAVLKELTEEEEMKKDPTYSITKDDFVSDIPDIEKDLRLTKEDSELSSLVEKLVRFDIRFKIINPKLSTEKIRVNLHIDMEAQKSYRPSNPSYPILKRAVYYVARDLSSQLSMITQATDYSKLEKCYSIWICAEDVPKKLQNTLTEYSFSKKDIIGVADEPEEDYDLLTVIIIRQGKETEENGIFEYLNGIFDGDIKRIQKYSHIK